MDFFKDFRFLFIVASLAIIAAHHGYEILMDRIKTLQNALEESRQEHDVTRSANAATYRTQDAHYYSRLECVESAAENVQIEMTNLIKTLERKLETAYESNENMQGKINGHHWKTKEEMVSNNTLQRISMEDRIKTLESALKNN